VARVADAAAARVRAGCLALQAPDPLSLFDEVYATPHPVLERQRDEYRSYLESFDSADGTGGVR
jgi:2-oxoisovalerate dehydrogenase E1 component alpha subunit